MKLQWSGNEEGLRQLREQEELLKQTEKKIKTLDSETNGTSSFRRILSYESDGFLEDGAD
jgi:hypothetical protein